MSAGDKHYGNKKRSTIIGETNARDGWEILFFIG